MSSFNIDYDFKKKTVFFRRVSSETQSLEMQITSDKVHRESMDPSSYIEINEDGVSAIKLTLSEREKMNELIRMIKAGEVSTIYVYDRSRFVRNFFEHMYLVQLFKTYGVNVFFTTEDPSYAPYSGNKLVEGMLAISSDEEGSDLKRRRRDSQARSPHLKYGFVKVLNESKQRFYKQDTKVKELLYDLFKSSLICKDIKELLVLIEDKRRGLKKSLSNLLKILIDPFYAGVYKASNQYYPMFHVEAYISVEELETITKIIVPFLDEKSKELKRLEKCILPTPYCCDCKYEMKYTSGNLKTTATYFCVNKKCKVSITQEKYNELLFSFLDKLLCSIPSQFMMIQMFGKIKKVTNEKRMSLKKIGSQIQTKQEKLVKLFGSQAQYSVIEKIEELRKKSGKLTREIKSLELYLKDKSLLSVLTLEPKNLLLNEKVQLINHLVGKVYINEHIQKIQLFYHPLVAEELKENLLYE